MKARPLVLLRVSAPENEWEAPFEAILPAEACSQLQHLSRAPTNTLRLSSVTDTRHVSLGPNVGQALASIETRVGT